MTHRRKSHKKTNIFQVFLVVGLILTSLLVGLHIFNLTLGVSEVASQTSVVETYSTSSAQDAATEDGSTFSVGSQAWLGNGGSVSDSYLAFKFSGPPIPVGSTVTSAVVELTSAQNQWIPVSSAVYAETTQSPAVFSSSNKLANRPKTSSNAVINDNVQWTAGSKYSYSVTSPIQELVSTSSRSTIVLLFKGTGSQWGRKFIQPQAKLTITYSSSPGLESSPTSSPTAVPTSVPSSTATPTPRPSATPVPTAPPATSTPVAPTTHHTAPTAIYGQASDEILGTCSQSVHDRFITTGPDGKLYRTWHPGTVPLDPANPSGPKCTFAHEHGDDPKTSTIYVSDIPFGFVGAQLVPPMDEPHAGFKCQVVNSGTRNDEGTTALHDSFFCFHMGTGGTARFSQRFHSLVFHIKTKSGYSMRVQGMADVGQVGTICNNPRQARTVMGFGCLLDSSYEIWENTLRINNKGTTLATAITSTAVFDSITVMDPANPARVVYAWDPEARQKIFKFNDDRTYYRGCNREEYHGPVGWYNRGGAQTYYTDAYGNVINGGTLKQELSTINTSSNSGYIDRFGGLIMGYKGGNTSDPQLQFKFHKSQCFNGLGLKN